MRVQESHKKDKEKYNDFQERRHTNFFYYHSPGIHKNQFYIEYEKNKREKIVAHIELVPGRPLRWNARLVGLAFLRVAGSLYKYFCHRHSTGRKSNRSKD